MPRMSVRQGSAPRSGRLSYEEFRARFGMPGENGYGVLFRFVVPADARALEDAGATYLYIKDADRIAAWRSRLEDAARRCQGDHRQPCGCSEYTHTTERTVLIATPVRTGP